MDESKEYMQLTIDDYLTYKKQLMQELNNMANGFIRTGYYLKKIRDAEAYQNDGYKNIYEFAEREYGITRTVASRFMSINDKFSEGGYSLELMEQYKGLGSSRLTEMLTLDVADHEMITNVTRIEDIRELKRFEKQEPEAEATPYDELYRNFFERKEKEFNAVMQLEEVKDIAEIVNPSGNKTWKYRMLFMAMKEYDKGISIRDYLKPVPDTITWEQFVEQCRSIFEYDHETAGTPYEQNYITEESGMDSENANIESGKESDWEDEKKEGEEKQKAEKKEIEQKQKEEETREEQQREKEEKQQEKETESKRKEAQAQKEPEKEEKTAENIDFLKQEQNTTEIRLDEPEVVTGEVENATDKDKNEVCDIAQTADFFNGGDVLKGYTVTFPAAIGEEIYAIEPESMDEDGKYKYRNTIIKPYLYEVRGRNNIKMYYHKSSSGSGSVDIRNMKAHHIYLDIKEAEQILEELNGKEE